MLASRLNVGATHALFCYDEDMRGQKKVRGQVKGVTCGHAKRLQRKCFSRPAVCDAGRITTCIDFAAPPTCIESRA